MGKISVKTVSIEDGIYLISSAEWHACINAGESVSCGYIVIYSGETGYFRNIVVCID